MHLFQRLRIYSPTAIVFLLILAAINITSCANARKATVITVPVKRSLPPLPVSSINIPIRMYMKPLLAAMDSGNAKEFTSDKWPEFFQSSCDFRYKYRFIRSPFTFSCTDNKVQIGFRGYYQIAGSKTVCAFNNQVSPWVSGTCGFGAESLRRVDLIIGSQISILPNHQVFTNTIVQSVKPIDKCQVTLLATDVTQQIMDSIAASVNAYSLAFDRFVQEVNNNEVLRQFRKDGSRVMPIAGYGYMNLNPVQLRIGKLNYLRDSLFFSVGFQGRPELHSDSARIVTNKPLPPVMNADAPGEIKTWINAVYDYTFFNKLLNDSLRNKPFEVEGRTFVIKNVALSGTAEGKLQVELAFSGNRSGRLRLSGTPVVDTINQVLSMPDIDFSLETRDLFANMAKGLFRKKIIRQLKNQTVLDLGALIARNKERIAARLNQEVNDWMSISGSLNKLEVKAMIADEQQLQLQFYIDANLVLNGHPPVSSFLSKK